MRPTPEGGLSGEIHLMCHLAQNECPISVSDLMMVIINTKLSQGPALNRLEDKAIE